MYFTMYKYKFLKNEQSALFYSFALAFKSTIIQFPCEVNIINKETCHSWEK